MATYSSRSLIEQLIKANGRFSGDPPAIRIVEYRTPEGETAWGVTYPGDRLDNYLDPSNPWVLEPRVIWEPK